MNTRIEVTVQNSRGVDYYTDMVGKRPHERHELPPA